MKLTEFVKGLYSTIHTGLIHLFRKRMTTMYPYTQDYPTVDMYAYDPKAGVAVSGWRGRHYLDMSKCTGCQLCYIACENIAEAIEMIPVPGAAHPQNKKSIYPGVDYGRCLPGWTLIMTDRGMIPIEKVQIGDRVLTHSGKFKRVTHLFRRNYTGRIYTFKTYGNTKPLTVTEGHPILVWRNNQLVWLTPEKICNGDYLTRPIIKEEYSEQMVTHTYEIEHEDSQGNYLTLEKKYLKISAQLLRLIGYYVSRGIVEGQNVIFEFKEMKLAEDMINCIEAIFGSQKRYISQEVMKNNFKIKISSPTIASFFSQFGSVEDKRLPAWLMTAAPSLQRDIIESARVDHYDGIIRLETCSGILASQYIFILERLGFATSVEELSKGNLVSYLVTASIQLDDYERYARKSEDMIFVKIKDIQVEDAEKMEVFNLEVEEDNSYVASNVVVHNCVFCGFCVDACPFYALYMTPVTELSELNRSDLWYSPIELSKPPPPNPAPRVNLKIDIERGAHDER